MVSMTVTEFARNLKSVFDRLEHKGDEVILTRNHHQIARILPGAPHLTAYEAMGDLHRTISEDAALDWQKDGRGKATLEREMRDPWDS